MFTFTELLQNPEKFSEPVRVKQTQQWLKDSYNITVADKNWISALSSVHNHDDMPYHFGQYQIGSSFSVITTQLLELPDGWHLAVSKNNETGMVAVHPKHEGSFMHPENQKLLLSARQVLKNGQLQTPAPQAFEMAAAPSVESLDIYSAKDREEQDSEAPTSNPVSLLPGATKSVSIDLSNF